MKSLVVGTTYSLPDLVGFLDVTELLAVVTRLLSSLPCGLSISSENYSFKKVRSIVHHWFV